MTEIITDDDAAQLIATYANDEAVLAYVVTQLIAAEAATEPTLIEAALRYAAAGQPVFPLRGKVPATEHGLHDASTDAAAVRAWWTAAPRANIGLRTGVLFDVIDVDVDHENPRKPNGYLALADLREAGMLPPVVGRALTPRGGSHLYVEVTGQGNRAKLAPGIDYRGDGGYVVAPPSAREDGARYRWTAIPAVFA